MRARARRARRRWCAAIAAAICRTRRREIERGLRDGSVRAVVSTNALELGIDIGALDVSVMAGYPGTIAATWQRAGRAGRRRRTVGGGARRVERAARSVHGPASAYFFDASPEHALINPDNLQILLDHIKCAAFELPFSADETFGQENVQQVLGVLGEEGFVHEADGQWNWTHESYPADAVSLRSISSDNFVIVDITHGTKVIGETDYTSAPSTLHEKAIYIIEGQLFQVERLDWEGRKAYVRSVDCDYYTDAITYSKVTIARRRRRASRRERRGCGRGRRIDTPTSALTVKSTSSPASSASRRSGSIPTRTSVRASSICPSIRCTRRRTG